MILPSLWGWIAYRMAARPATLRPRIRSGAWCHCERCGHVGYAYGTIMSSGGSAPWCEKCGMNDALVEVSKP